MYRRSRRRAVFTPTDSCVPPSLTFFGGEKPLPFFLLFETVVQDSFIARSRGLDYWPLQTPPLFTVQRLSLFDSADTPFGQNTFF